MTNSRLKPRELKRRTDFVAIVSRYAKLRRAGRQYVGLCPFHSERTPSFYVDPQWKVFKCFGRCDASGDLFDFIMRVEGCGFFRAMEIVVAFGVAPDSETRSGSRFGGREGAKPLDARSASYTSSQGSRAGILASLDATERRNAAIEATNAAQALEFATACEPERVASEFIRHRITSQEAEGVRRGRS